MADEKTTIKQLLDYIAEFEGKRDWRRFHTPKNLATGVAIETGELLEHFQWLTDEQSLDVVRDEAAMAGIREEMADVFCYLLNLALVLDIDLSQAFYDKMKRNDAKYPAEKYRGRYKL